MRDPCYKKGTSGRKVACAIWSLVNAKDLQLECARMLQEVLFMFVLLYGNKKMIW